MPDPTRALLEKARVLMKARDAVGLDALEAEAEATGDKLALGLVRLGRELVPAIIKVWRENGLLAE